MEVGDELFSCLEASWVDLERSCDVLLLSAVEFRERTDKNRERCEFLEWYAYLLDGAHPVRITAPRPKSTLVKYVDWLRRAVCPTLKAMAVESESDVSRVFEKLCGDMDDWDKAKMRPVLWEFREFLVRRFTE